MTSFGGGAPIRLRQGAATTRARAAVLATAIVATIGTSRAVACAVLSLLAPAACSDVVIDRPGTGDGGGGSDGTGGNGAAGQAGSPDPCAGGEGIPCGAACCDPSSSLCARFVAHQNPPRFESYDSCVALPPACDPEALDCACVEGLCGSLSCNEEDGRLSIVCNQ